MASLTLEQEQDLVERHKPLLVLYPEIDTPTRRVVPDWYEKRIAPLERDYHPRDVRLVLEHSGTPRRFLWFGRSAVGEHERERLLDRIDRDEGRRIDILTDAGHGDRDAFWRTYHAIVSNRPPHEADEVYPHRAYAHVVYGDNVVHRRNQDGAARPYKGLIAIEYWMLYVYNDWRATHEGDWELVVVFLDRSGGEPAPAACAYSAHHGGFRLAWPHVEKANDARARDGAGTHPIAYVANGSHANYFYGPGVYATSTEAFGARITSGEFPFIGEFLDFTTSFDEEKEDDGGKPVFPEVTLVPRPADGRWSGELRWLNFTGEWGSMSVSKNMKWLARLVKRLPIKPLQRIWGAPASLPGRRNWADPFNWADDECEEAPAPDSWLTLHRRPHAP